jgi:hypothetical protein
MGVSRLDSFALLTGQAGNTTGSVTATEHFFIGPCNGLISVLASGTFGGGTLSLEVFDGTNWVAVSGSNPATLTAPGTLTWQGSALGVRCKLTGATSPNLNATVVLTDFS